MLPVVQRLYFEILLILGSTTQTEGFGIGYKTVLLTDALHIGDIGPSLQDETGETQRFECFVNDDVCILGVQFLFAAVVSVLFRNRAAQSKMAKQ